MGLTGFAKAVQSRPRQPAEPTLLQETHNPLGATSFASQADQSVASEASLFLAYSGSGEVIHRLARSQRTPNLARVARTVSPVMGSLVKPKPSSKLTSAARSSVHTLVPLPNFLGLWCKSSPKASACSESKAL